MAKEKVRFDVKKIGEALKNDGRSKSKFAAEISPKVDRRTVTKAFEGKEVRSYVGERIAQGFGVDISKLVSSADLSDVNNSMIKVDLSEIKLEQGDLSVDDSCYTRAKEGILTLEAWAYPLTAEQLMMHLRSAGIKWSNPHGLTPSPYWHATPEITKGALSVLKDLSEAIDAVPSELTDGARSLNGLIISLDQDADVDHCLKRLRDTGVHVLGTLLKVLLNDGEIESEFRQYSQWKIPLFVVALTKINKAQILYKSLAFLDDPNIHYEMPF